MNILYIDHYAGSQSMGMEFRPAYLAKEWKKLGAKTTILAGDFSHLRHHNPDPVKKIQLQKIDDVPFLFLPTGKYQGNGIDRIRSMMRFVYGGIRRKEKILRLTRPDVIIASSTYPMDTWLAKALAKKNQLPIIHEIHDLWPMTPMELGGYSEKHPFIRLVQKAEDDAYRQSKLIVSILPNAVEHVRNRGFQTPVVHIPNGVFLESQHAGDQGIMGMVARLQAAGKTVIGYAGGLSISNAMDDLILAAELLRHEPYAFVIIGNGIQHENLQQMVYERDLTNVHFYAPIPRNKITGTLMAMDGLYIGSKMSPLYHYGVGANKIFDYMLTGKPIVNAFDSDHSPLVYCGCALKAEAEDPLQIAAAIRGIRSLSAEQKGLISRKSISYIQENHLYPVLAEHFLEEIKKIMK